MNTFKPNLWWNYNIYGQFLFNSNHVKIYWTSSLPSPSLRLPPLPTPISRAFLNLRPGSQLSLSICHCFFNHPSWEDTYRGTGRPKMGPHTGIVVCVSGSGGRTVRLFDPVSQLSGRGLSCTPQLLTLRPRSPSCWLSSLLCAWEQARTCGRGHCVLG